MLGVTEKNLVTSEWKGLEKNIDLIILIYKRLNEILNFCILIKYWGTTVLYKGIQHARMFKKFPRLIELSIYLFDLNKEVSLSLEIMVYDAQRKMLTIVILLYIL